MSEKVQKLFDDLSSLTIVEINQLSKKLEAEWGVSASAAVFAAPVAASAGSTGGEQQQKTEFNVKLKSAGQQKIAVIKVVKDLTGLGLTEAKALVDKAPVNIKEKVSKDDAEKIKKELEAAGAEVEIE